MTTPLVSVVIPTLDRANVLPRVLSSICGQEVHHPEDLEIVVVDDGSTDATGQILAGWPDSRLRVIRHERPGGVSHARNVGTAYAQGRWVAWCDDDDLWAPDKLRLQLDALDSTPGALWCNGGVVNVDERLQLLNTRPCPPREDLGRILLSRNFVTGGGSGVLADRELVLRLGGFDEELAIYADWHMWARLAQAAPVAVVDVPLVAYVDHAGGMSHQRKCLMAELVTLGEKLQELCPAGEEVQIDTEHLTWWFLRQQVRSGRHVDALLLYLKLAASQRVPLRHIIPSMTVGLVAPGVRLRRWERREKNTIDARYAAEVEPWLSKERDAIDAPATAP